MAEFLFCISGLFFFLSPPQTREVSVRGTYQGENIFVQNPLAPDKKNFCTKEIYINGQLRSAGPKASAFIIDLSHLSINQNVTIYLVHEEGCTPVFVNPQVIQSTRSFNFTYVEADANMINWVTKGESSGNQFYLERQIDEDWIATDTIPARGSMFANQYSLKAPHYPGSNTYRLRYLDESSETLSEVFDFYSTAPQTQVYNDTTFERITFSRIVAFELFDFEMRLLKKGKGFEVDIKDLRDGTYYIRLEGRTEELILE